MLYEAQDTRLRLHAKKWDLHHIECIKQTSSTNQLPRRFCSRPAAMASGRQPNADRPALLINDTLAHIYKDTPAVVCWADVDDKFESACRDFVLVYSWYSRE